MSNKSDDLVQNTAVLVEIVAEFKFGAALPSLSVELNDGVKKVGDGFIKENIYRVSILDQPQISLTFS